LNAVDEVQAWVEEACANIDAQMAEAQRKAVAAAKMAEDMERVVGQARSRRGEVAVATDASGRVIDLRLTDEAMRYRSNDLARMLLETIEQARRDSSRQALDLARDTLGEDSLTFARIAADLGGTEGGRGVRS